MLTILAWLIGGVSLFATVVLAVMAIGQVVYGPGPLLLPAVVGAAVAFCIAWACSRRIDASRKPARNTLDVAPSPVALAEGEFVIHMRWDKWLTATLVVAGLSAFSIVGLLDGLARDENKVLPLSFAAAVLVPTTILLLEFARRALRLGGLARLDAQGFWHCLLPAVSWKVVRGIDLELQVVRGANQWHLVLAVEPALVRSLRLAWWWRVLGTGTPRIDEEGRLTVPLVYARGTPQVLAGKAMTVADCWGAPRMPGWRSYLPTNRVAGTGASRVSSQDALRATERLMQQLRVGMGHKSVMPGVKK